MSGCMVGSRFVTGFSGGGREGDLRPYARADVAVDAPAPGHGVDQVQPEAAAVLQIGRPSRDRSGAAAILNLQAQDVGPDVSAYADDGIGGRVGVTDAVADQLTDQQQ